MSRTKKILKSFDAYIDGDGELRKLIFAEKPASQQVVFELFSQLDQVHYSFFLHFFAIPSTKFWDVLLTQLAAIASGSARNRNFCENYDLLTPCIEGKTPYTCMRDKVVDLVGASHALFWELSDPKYKDKPNVYGLWRAVADLNPSRITWEHWFEQRSKEILGIFEQYKEDLTKPEAEVAFEIWAEDKLGLYKPRTHWYSAAQTFIRTFKDATVIKNKISKPYLRIVYTLVKSIAAYNQPEQFFDTFNIAVAGLMKSIAKYSPSMSLAFSNFAESEIRFEVYYQLSSYNMVALPHKIWQKYREFEKLKKQYFEIYKKDASLEDLAKVYNLDLNELYEVYQLVSLQNPSSLDQKIYTEEKNSLAVTVKDKIEDPASVENRKILEDQEILILALNRMSLKERKIFVMLHNLCDLVQDLTPDEKDLIKFFNYKNMKNLDNTLMFPLLKI